MRSTCRWPLSFRPFPNSRKYISIWPDTARQKGPAPARGERAEAVVKSNAKGGLRASGSTSISRQLRDGSGPLSVPLRGKPGRFRTLRKSQGRSRLTVARRASTPGKYRPVFVGAAREALASSEVSCGKPASTRAGFGAGRRDGRAPDCDQASGLEGRKNPVRRRRDRLHGPQYLGHRRGAGRWQPAWNSGAVHLGYRGQSSALPRRMAQGKADRRHLRSKAVTGHFETPEYGRSTARALLRGISGIREGCESADSGGLKVSPLEPFAS